jgi:RimJ/RimL family protein N-acetyltransferase
VEPQRFPEIIETERLRLRRYREGDAAGILELARDNRARLVREFAQIAGLETVEDAQLFIAEKYSQWESGQTFCYGIWSKPESELIGQIQIKNIGWEIPSAELGYFIGASWLRQGYASESIRHVLRLAFVECSFERIFVRILPSNADSFSLAKKLGFREEGAHRNAFRCGLGELHDVRVLALTAEDYQLEESSRRQH